MSGNPRHPSIPSRPFNPREVKKGEAPPHRVEAVTSPTKINPFQQSCKTPRSPNKDLRSSDDKNLLFVIEIVDFLIYLLTVILLKDTELLLHNLILLVVKKKRGTQLR